MRLDAERADAVGDGGDLRRQPHAQAVRIPVPGCRRRAWCVLELPRHPGEHPRCRAGGRGDHRAAAAPRGCGPQRRGEACRGVRAGRQGSRAGGGAGRTKRGAFAPGRGTGPDWGRAERPVRGAGGAERGVEDAVREDPAAQRRARPPGGSPADAARGDPHAACRGRRGQPPVLGGARPDRPSLGGGGRSRAARRDDRGRGGGGRSPDGRASRAGARRGFVRRRGHARGPDRVPFGLLASPRPCPAGSHRGAPLPVGPRVADTRGGPSSGGAGGLRARPSRVDGGAVSPGSLARAPGIADHRDAAPPGRHPAAGGAHRAEPRCNHRPGRRRKSLLLEPGSRSALWLEARGGARADHRRVAAHAARPRRDPAAGAGAGSRHLRADASDAGGQRRHSREPVAGAAGPGR